MAVARTSPPHTAVRPARRRLGVVVVDGLPVVRAGLAMLIDARPDMDVLGEAGTADEGLAALAKVRRTAGVVALVGLGLEGEHDSFWLIRQLRQRFPGLSIVACGARSEPLAISRALFMGADGFVDKNVDPPEFLQSLRSAAAGEMVLAGPPAEWVGAIAEGLERRRDAEVTLTEREREVLAVAAQGLTARQIAERLGVRERTVTTHLGRIYSKLGVGSRVQALRAAATAGLVTVGPIE
jgi:DNA-binding NarL/FixJ family response regulator